MMEEQIAKYKAQAEESKRRMLGAEDKWKSWAEESLGDLTTERDEALLSELNSHEQREKVLKDMKLTQHSVEVLAAIEAHQRVALVEANSAISKVVSLTLELTLCLIRFLLARVLSSMPCATG